MTARKPSRRVQVIDRLIYAMASATPEALEKIQDKLRKLNSVDDEGRRLNEIKAA